MTKGRKPTPTALKILEGNPGKRALPKHEPMPGDPLEKPAYLTGRASDVWDAIAPRLFWLRGPDSPALALWAGLQAEIEGGLSAVPASRLAQWRALASELGLTPSARARLGGNDAPEKPSKFAGLIGIAK